jgi:hypothetical protein
MDLGMIGLGRMGANMTDRLVKGGHRVVGFDPQPAARVRVEDKGAESASSLDMLVASLKVPRTLWMMVPAGSVTDSTVTALLPLLAAGDMLVDGGNSNYKDTLRRSNAAADKKIRYVDCGTSGGVWGLAEGRGRSLDRRRSDRPGRSRTGNHPVAPGAIALARHRIVLRQAALRDAQSIQWSRDQEGMSATASISGQFEKVRP